MTTEIAEYSQTQAALADLSTRYAAVVFDVKTTAGMKSAITARAEVRGYRTSLETLRKEIKAPALSRCNAIDSEAKRITAALESLEKPIDAQIKIEESRKEAERIAKMEAERLRIAGITAKIDAIRGAIATAAGMTSKQIATMRNQLAATRFDAEWLAQFSEFGDEARAARDSAVIGLADLQDRVARQEAEAAQIEADRRELAELKRLQVEQEAAAAKARAAEDARINAEREAERAADILRVNIENRRINAERKLLADQQAEADRLAAIERAAEARRMESEREKLREEQAEVRRREAAVAATEQRSRDVEVARVKAEADARAAAELPAPLEQAALERNIGIRPDDDIIVAVLAEHYRVQPLVVIDWLEGMDLDAARAEYEREFA